MIEFLRIQYKLGKITMPQLLAMQKKNIITQENIKQIVGD